MPYKDPEKRRAHSRKYRAENLDKVKARQNTHYAANRNARRNKTLKSKYGLTQEQWDAMFRAQGSKCKICLSTDPGSPQWHTDHCHTTGQVRGILCHGCNIGLGGFKDNTAALARAIDYLGNS